MKYYDNDIYPIALVLSRDAKSVDKEYYNAVDGEDCHISVKSTSAATTMPLARRATYHAMAVGIVFNKKPDVRILAHKAFHATRMITEMSCHILLMILLKKPMRISSDGLLNDTKEQEWKG